MDPSIIIGICDTSTWMQRPWSTLKINLTRFQGALLIYVKPMSVMFTVLRTGIMPSMLRLPHRIENFTSVVKVRRTLKYGGRKFIEELSIIMRLRQANNI